MIARGKPVTRLHCCPSTTYPVTNRLHPSYTVTSLSISNLAWESPRCAVPARVQRTEVWNRPCSLGPAFPSPDASPGDGDGGAASHPCYCRISLHLIP